MEFPTVLPRTSKEFAYLVLVLIVAAILKAKTLGNFFSDLFKTKSEKRESIARAVKIEAEADEIRSHSVIDLIDRLEQSQTTIGELRDRIGAQAVDLNQCRRDLQRSQSRERIYELELRKSETGRKFLETFMLIDETPS